VPNEWASTRRRADRGAHRVLTGVIDSKTEAGSGRDVDLWPELHEELASHKSSSQHLGPDDYVFATSTGKPDSRSNIARRLKRAVGRANRSLATDEVSPIPVELTPHSLRRTFASLLYLRGENPVYVMHQMGHSDPKLALRIYTRVMAEQRRRGPGARLVSVLNGAQWTETEIIASRGQADDAVAMESVLH
jgi:integrase